MTTLSCVFHAESIWKEAARKSRSAFKTLARRIAQSAGSSMPLLGAHLLQRGFGQQPTATGAPRILTRLGMVPAWFRPPKLNGRLHHFVRAGNATIGTPLNTG